MLVRAVLAVPGAVTLAAGRHALAAPAAELVRRVAAAAARLVTPVETLVAAVTARRAPALRTADLVRRAHEGCEGPGAGAGGLGLVLAPDTVPHSVTYGGRRHAAAIAAPEIISRAWQRTVLLVLGAGTVRAAVTHGGRRHAHEAGAGAREVGRGAAASLVLAARALVTAVTARGAGQTRAVLTLPLRDLVTRTRGLVTPVLQHSVTCYHSNVAQCDMLAAGHTASH